MNNDYLTNETDNQYQEEIKLKKEIEKIETLAKQYMTREALSRFGNIKIAHPEKALQVAIAIVNAAKSGLKERIDDSMLKEILMQLSEEKRETKIKWR